MAAMTSESAWDCFEESDEDEEQQEINQCHSDIFHHAYLNLFQMLGSAKKEVQFGSKKVEEIDMKPIIHIVGEETSTFMDKLTQANFVVRSHNDNCVGNIDCVVDLRVRKVGQPLDQELKTQFSHIRNGGLVMFIIEIEPNTDYNENNTTNLANSVVNKSLWLTEGAKVQRCSETIGLLFVRKRGVLVNQSAICYKPDNAKLLAVERALAEEVSVCRPCSSIAAGTLSQSDINRAVSALEEHGVCVIPHMFDGECVKEWGRVAITDIEHAMKILKESGVEEKDESVFGGDGLSNNYHELAMREAYRVDIRQGPRMIIKAARIEAAREEDAQINIPSARHAGLMKVFQAVMNPHPPTHGSVDSDSPRPMSSGNFGRWNFEGSGPTHEVPLNIGSVGAVMSMPRCADQGIDTFDIF